MYINRVIGVDFDSCNPELLFSLNFNFVKILLERYGEHNSWAFNEYLEKKKYCFFIDISRFFSTNSKRVRGVLKFSNLVWIKRPTESKV